MLDVQSTASVNFPDDPLKWDGWSKYRAENPYERLCLDASANPDEEQIQQHCSALVRWWQKKVALKNQPSNPIAQLLGRGIDEASRFLVEGRMQLLDPVRRRQIDSELAARVQQEALSEFSKYVAFSLARRVLTADAEANLREFGQRTGLSEEQTRTCIEQELRRHRARRATVATSAVPVASTPRAQGEAEEQFHHILNLSRLDLGDATPLVRRIFATIAENLGIHLERAEHLLDEYLEKEEYRANNPASPRPQIRNESSVTVAVASRRQEAAPAAEVGEPASVEVIPSGSEAEFINPVGAAMVLIAGGEFVMGSAAPDAAPNEKPLTPIALSEFYMSRHPVTNAQYEQFDPTHRQKRMEGAGDDHPVVYVSSLEASRFCQWLAQKDRRNYRLPTEAEWEYAARGTDGRKYPWGNDNHRGDFANFADASTTFPWRDPQVHDGYPETSPVGAFPRGASFFGLHDMAGNVWEWCLDFYQPLTGTPKRNPRGLVSGTQRLYRGGSWKSRFTNIRATARSSNAATYSCNDVGFRIAERRVSYAGDSLNR